MWQCCCRCRCWRRCCRGGLCCRVWRRLSVWRARKSRALAAVLVLVRPCDARVAAGRADLVMAGLVSTISFGSWHPPSHLAHLKPVCKRFVDALGARLVGVVVCQSALVIGSVGGLWQNSISVRSTALSASLLGSLSSSCCLCRCGCVWADGLRQSRARCWCRLRILTGRKQHSSPHAITRASMPGPAVEQRLSLG